MTRYSFVYFDLDDTLLDHRKAERLGLSDLFGAYRNLFDSQTLDRVLDTYHTVNTDVWHRYGDGVITKDRAKLERFELLLHHLKIDESVSVSELSDYYLSRYSNYWSYLPGAQEAFLSIAERYEVGILTNGFQRVQNAKLDQFPDLRQHSASIVISEEVGYMKPDVRIFEYATIQAGCRPEEILYVGDSFRSDVEGGQGAGWHVAWLFPAPDDRLPDPRFTTWTDILEWLELS